MLFLVLLVYLEILQTLDPVGTEHCEKSKEEMALLDTTVLKFSKLFNHQEPEMQYCSL